MITLDEVAAMAEALPEVTVGERYGNRTWLVRRIAWRIQMLADATPPDGPIVAISVDDMEEKEAVLAARHRGFFDIEHFKGFPAVLVQLRVAAPGVVREALVDGWLSVAPSELAEAYLAAKAKFYEDAHAKADAALRARLRRDDGAGLTG